MVMVIREYIENLIENRRKIIYESELLDLTKKIYKSNKIRTVIEFKRLYNKAKETKKEEDIKKAIDYYNKNIKEGLNFSKEIEKMYNELEALYKSCLNKKKQDVYNKKWAHRNNKKVTVSEIEYHLRNIVNKLKENKKCIEDFNKYHAKLIVKNVFEDSNENYVEFQIIYGNQEACCDLDDYLYKIKDRLETELPINVECTNDDKTYEGCLYIWFSN